VANPAIVKQLPAAIHAPYIAAVAASLRPVFLAAAGISLLAFLLTWLLREIPLRQTSRSEAVAEGIPPQRDDDSQRELERIVAGLDEREERRRVYRQVIERSGVAIQPDESWLLARVAERGPTTVQALAAEFGLEPQAIASLAGDLASHGYFTRDGDVSDGTLAVTPAGRDALERLIRARRDQLCKLLDGWRSAGDADTEAALERMAGALIAEIPAR
jgi:DNA-binding MarR family transcriptional regulator